MNRIVALLSAVGLVFAVGCAPSSDYRIRFVDEVNGEGISGVRMSVDRKGTHFGNRFLPDNGKTVERYSGDDGTLSLRLKVDENYYCYPMITYRPGYQAAGGTLYPGTGRAALSYYPFDAEYPPPRPPVIPPATGPARSTDVELRFASGGNLLIPMRRLPTYLTDPTSPRAAVATPAP
jgi:hypothetical protein